MNKRSSAYDYDKYLEALYAKRTEIMIDIKRNERKASELQRELAETQTAIDDVEREHLKRNEL